jgi:hypothetical protein
MIIGDARPPTVRLGLVAWLVIAFGFGISDFRISDFPAF